MKSRHYIFAAKIMVIIWGFFISFIGALYQAFGTSDDSYLTVLGASIFLTYSSPLLAGLIGLLSSRIAAVLQFVAGLVAVALVFSAYVDSRSPTALKAAIGPIIYGPLATSLALFAIYKIERQYASSRSRR
jgi:hypothetical protein